MNGAEGRSQHKFMGARGDPGLMRQQRTEIGEGGLRRQ